MRGQDGVPIHDILWNSCDGMMVIDENRRILAMNWDAPEKAGIPIGWVLQKCLNEGINCAGKECPLRMVCRAKMPSP